MCDSLGNRQKAVDAVVEGIGEQAFCEVVGGRTVFADEGDNAFLAFVDGTDVAVKDLFEISYRLAVAAVGKRWCVTTEAGKTNQILSERMKSPRRVHRVGGEHRIWRNAF